MASLAPQDKAALLLYWKSVHDSIDQGNLHPKILLGMIQKGLDLTQKAYQGVTCLTCGMPWSEHPSTTPGGTDYFCIVVPEAKA